MTGHITLSQLARQWEIRPNVLTYLVWTGEIDRERCPLLGRVRWIPLSYVPTIRKMLVTKGKLPAKSPAPA